MDLRPAALFCALPLLLHAGPGAVAYVARPASITGLEAATLSLDGVWRFNPEPPPGFEALAPAAFAGWAPIAVPAEWVLQGFNVPAGKPAAYLRTFEVPGAWQGQRVLLRFGAVHAVARVFVNGRPAGGHEGGFTPFELDVTDLLQPGANTLALAVTCEGVADALASASQYVNHALGGIQREVSLLALPPVHARNLAVTTPLAADFRTGRIEVAFDLVNDGKAAAKAGRVEAALLDPEGRTVALPVSGFDLPGPAAGGSGPVRLSLPLASARTWNPEQPRLYTLTLKVQVPGQREAVLVQKVGVRQLEVRGKELLLNGQVLRLRGVCRHETDPLTGRADTARLGRRDVALFRSGNVNYIRTSHYPPTEAFLEACDELGMIVECEAALCWVQHGANEHWKTWNYLDPAFLPHLARANLENVACNRNHPSILVWSLGNESCWSPLWAQVLQAVKAADPTRPTSFHDQSYGDYNNAGSLADLANYHYPSPGDLVRYLPREQRPQLFGEFHHVSAYDRGELEADPGVRDEWGRPFKAMADAMYHTPGLLGGAIWAGLDDLFHLPDGRSVGYGTWGILDGWRRPKPEFWHMKKSYSPVRVLVRNLELPACPELRIPVENRQLFSDLDTLTITWSLGPEQGLVTAQAPPGGRGELVLRPRTPLQAGQALDLRFVDGRGVEVETERLVLGAAPAPAARAPFGEPVAVVTRPELFRLQAAGVTVDIDRRTGLIREARAGGRTVLAGGPVLQVLALHSDECLPEYQRGLRALNDVCAGWKAGRVSQEGAAVRVEGAYDGAEGTYTLRLDDAGRLSVDYAFKLAHAVDPRQWGVVFYAPGTFDTLQWRREAFWSTYPEDHIGRPEGTAQALAGPEDLRRAPAGPWSRDAHPLGTADFRSSKAKVVTASLRDAQGPAFTVLGEGRQAVRAFVDGPRVGLLVAGFHGGGGELFYAENFQEERRPIKAHGELRDRVVLDLARHGADPAVTRGDLP